MKICDNTYSKPISIFDAVNLEEAQKKIATIADIVIVEYQAGIVVDEGSWCHVFVHDRVKPIADKLWHTENWIRIDTNHPAITCLYVKADIGHVIGRICRYATDIMIFLEHTKRKSSERA